VREEGRRRPIDGIRASVDALPDEAAEVERPQVGHRCGIGAVAAARTAVDKQLPDGRRSRVGVALARTGA
jgi:hypothetical protein